MMTTHLQGSRMALLAAGLGAVSLAHAQAYPSKTVRIIVPTAPGGGSDTVSRLVAAELGKRWGQSMVVENRAGGGTIVGSEVVAKAPPDGYTLLMSPSTLATNPTSYKKMPYDALRDFAPILQTIQVPNLVVIHPSVPARTIKEFIALAKSRPGELLYASAGHGTNPHLTVELFASMANIKLSHIPYKGSLPGIIDLVGGRVALSATSSAPVLIPHIKADRLRALGVTTSKRTQAMPDVPAIAESVPGYESVQWSGLLAPAGTPREIVDKLHKDVHAFITTPEMRARLLTENFEVHATSPSEFAAFIRSETVKWAQVAKAAGIVPE